ncbi:FAD-dependent oxidoreductase [Halobium palmae]|uniref:FAD-dependent oxidoreductase n=1 Tax=Halobium palmae TaxID=1776492 RepID=A0ABD5RUY0_9EURY
MVEWDHTTDVVIVGSGAGGMVSALYAADNGLDALVLEKSETYGGSSALSGGGLWIPANHHMRAEGVPDSVEKARIYLKETVGDRTTQAKQDAYVENAREMAQWLEENTRMEFTRMDGYADYYPERPGGMGQGRGLEPVPMDGRELGGEREQLNAMSMEIPGPLSFTAGEFHDIGFVMTTTKGKLAALKVGVRAIVNLVRNVDALTMGQALIGRLRWSLLEANVPIWLNSPFEEFVLEGDRVVGVVADTEHDGRVRLRARQGVILAAGGFAHNEAMREKYQQHPITTDWTVAHEGNTGDTIQAGIDELGAAVDLMDDAWWGPVSLPPGKDPMFHVAERNEPGAIIVNGQGERFTNESASYVDVGHAMYEHHSEENPHVPSYFVMDQRFKNRYIFEMVFPRQPFPSEYLDSGYVTKADTLSELAHELGVPADNLTATVNRFNTFARHGTDTDYDRGASAYDRYYGDPSHGPNPCLGTIEQGPFYAVKMWPGDLGTKGGLLTDEWARVLREDGSIIEGLYATGNNMASVMGHTYPGPGSTLGPSTTFGYLAVKDIVENSSPANADDKAGSKSPAA